MRPTRPRPAVTGPAAVAVALALTAPAAAADGPVTLTDSDAASQFEPIPASLPNGWERIVGADTPLEDRTATFVVPDVSDGQSSVHWQADGEITVVVEQHSDGSDAVYTRSRSGLAGSITDIEFAPDVEKTITVTTGEVPELEQVAPTGQSGEQPNDASFTEPPQIRLRITDIYNARGLRTPDNFEQQVGRVLSEGTSYLGEIRDHAERDAEEGNGSPLDGWSHTAQADMDAAAAAQASTVRVAFDQPAVPTEEVRDEADDQETPADEQPEDPSDSPAEDEAESEEPAADDAPSNTEEPAAAGGEDDFGEAVVDELPHTGGILAAPALLLGLGLLVGGRKLYTATRD